MDRDSKIMATITVTVSEADSDPTLDIFDL